MFLGIERQFRVSKVNRVSSRSLWVCQVPWDIKGQGLQTLGYL